MTVLTPDEALEAVNGPHGHRTDQAEAYMIVAQRREDYRAPTWDDVAKAYDAGLYSGAMNKRMALRALEVIEPGHTVVASVLRKSNLHHGR